MFSRLKRTFGVLLKTAENTLKYLLAGVSDTRWRVCCRSRSSVLLPFWDMDAFTITANFPDSSEGSWIESW
ncbi:MAG: hypothetical protein DWQ34_02015 [Planctomycetota bacterium]|nr:MAG: hypothetical protein DWQ34_02015 [Planctomycetota bacterium]REK20998.1 MAG: hypothetical protein DWQ41_23435 [Planctomycetota bacterium]REK37221.1 MAG: hypothetical protein DWQ45_07155 [Planctomycetota bacterium]